MKVIVQNLWRVGLLWFILVGTVIALSAQNLPADSLTKVVVIKYECSEYSAEFTAYPRHSPSGVYFNQSYVLQREIFDCYSRGLPNPCTLTQKREKRFVYQVKIRNAGKKQIVALDWDYLFIEPETKKIIAHHSFNTQTRIQPHKSKTLSEISTLPPTNIIDVRMLNKNPASQFIEQIVVNSVVFHDE